MRSLSQILESQRAEILYFAPYHEKIRTQALNDFKAIINHMRGIGTAETDITAMLEKMRSDDRTQSNNQMGKIQ